MRFLFLGLLCVAALFATTATEVTGKWRGKIHIESSGPDNGGGTPAYMELVQKDNAVTGRMGGDENETFAIRDGKLEGDKLTVSASPREGRTLSLTLTVKGDALEGDVAEDGQRIGSVKLDRVK